jgi:hypothetical protein
MRSLLLAIALLFCTQQAVAHQPVRPAQRRQVVVMWMRTPTGWMWVRYPVYPIGVTHAGRSLGR